MRSLTAAICLIASLGVHAQAPASFTLESLEGESHTLPEEQEGVGIYLFWASWCPYCQALMPHIQSIVDEYGDGVTVYALNFRDKKDPAHLIEENGFDFTVFPDADEVAEEWGVHGTPGLFIVDSSGEVHLNLYDVVTETPPGYDELGHAQKAARRAPFWAARIRETLDGLPDLRD
ncbi:TlpA family protein disulfide reductase [Wenzhouxiangella sp. XN201]|uniref:TlpA family protein disulfide reductase n=1 Tax=Wenzhouxiangella sp. XN201 TaxID=2710755 RepID=UPI0013C5893E|nr:TlpA disulfide reductase family protein [Wenzhouxiangella sp. XN201]NEZ04888.1 TlpA family protein disulfide reductase [Wenzhouxiangella sp. XN201]